MVKSCGCKIVEIGHAERYKYFNETDILVNKKIIQAIKNNLIPLVCFVGAARGHFGGVWGSGWGYRWEVCGGVLEGYWWYFDRFVGGKHKEQITYC